MLEIIISLNVGETDAGHLQNKLLSDRDYGCLVTAMIEGYRLKWLRFTGQTSVAFGFVQIAYSVG